MREVSCPERPGGRAGYKSNNYYNESREVVYYGYQVLMGHRKCKSLLSSLRNGLQTARLEQGSILEWGLTIQMIWTCFGNRPFVLATCAVNSDQVRSWVFWGQWIPDFAFFFLFRSCQLKCQPLAVRPLDPVTRICPQFPLCSMIRSARGLRCSCIYSIQPSLPQ